MSPFRDLDDLALTTAAQLARHSPLLDNFVVNFLNRASIKLAPIVLCLWVMWFASRERQKARLSVINAVVAGSVAMVIGRAIQNFGPGRPRPMHAGLADYVAPYGANTNALPGWSSFPSDHATLAFALSAAVCAYSWRVGGFCLVWSLFVVSLPRIYYGHHYATDILAGMAIGLLSAVLVQAFRRPQTLLLAYAESIERRYSGAFYALAFFASLQMVTMFEDIRAVAVGVFRVLAAL